MKGSTLVMINSLKAQLAEFPKVVTLLEQKDPGFMDRLQQWMRKTEEILTTCNVSEVSEIAGLRSKLLTAKYAGTTMGQKKESLRIAATILYDLQNTTLMVLKPLEQKLNEARVLIRQILNIISQTNLVKYSNDQPFEQFISDIWQIITGNDQLKPGVVQLKTNFSVNDILILLAEEINLEDF